MGSLEKAKENGLTIEQERNLNVLRGVVLGSYLTNPEKVDLCNFITDIERYFNEESEDEE